MKCVRLKNLKLNRWVTRGKHKTFLRTRSASSQYKEFAILIHCNFAIWGKSFNIYFTCFQQWYIHNPLFHENHSRFLSVDIQWWLIADLFQRKFQILFGDSTKIRNVFQDRFQIWISEWLRHTDGRRLKTVTPVEGFFKLYNKQKGS